MHDVQEGLGQTGKFGEGFVGLGLLGLIGGAILVFMAVFAAFEPWAAGDAVEIDALVSGSLFVVMGLGFITFGVMIILSGWARHHPGFDEHGFHPTKAQEEE